MEYGLGFVYGALALFIVGMLAVPYKQQAELYRFCLDRQIKLEECVIPEVK